MKPAATIAAFKFSVSAKSAAALKNSRKVLIRLSGRAVRRSIALNGDAVGRHRMQSPQAPFRMADPAAGRLEIPFAPGSQLLLEKVVWRLDQGFRLLLAKRRV